MSQVSSSTAPGVPRPLPPALPFHKKHTWSCSRGVVFHTGACYCSWNYFSSGPLCLILVHSGAFWVILGYSRGSHSFGHWVPTLESILAAAFPVSIWHRQWSRFGALWVALGGAGSLWGALGRSGAGLFGALWGAEAFWGATKQSGAVRYG